MSLQQTWCQTRMSEPKEKTRYGLWAATGVYRWFAFSESPDDEKFPCLDLRRKVSACFGGKNK